jgi:hypothetical protein
MLAIPIVFIGITLLPFGAIGRWISLGLFLFVNLLLWGALVVGFYVNVYAPWRLRKTTKPDNTSTGHDD